MAVIIILLAFVMVPLDMAKALWHSLRYNHDFDVLCVDFYFKLSCHDCDAVFTKETE